MICMKSAGFEWSHKELHEISKILIESTGFYKINLSPIALS